MNENDKNVIKGTNPDIPPSDVEFTINKEEKKKDRITDDEEVKEKKFLRDLLPYIAILVVVIFIRTYIATPIKVNGPSMQPTLNGGETMILNKLGKLERFKIVVVNTSNDHLIKRIIGLPGEKIEYRNDKLLINDEEIADNFGDGYTKNFGPVILGEDEYFVMGDNRGNSTDSRDLGPIAKKYITGTTNLKIFPFKEAGKVE